MTSAHWIDQTAAATEFVSEAVKNPDGTLMAFDFDGTLSRIVPNPDDARMVEGSAEALDKLAAAGVHLAIISGRPVDALLKLSRATERPGLSNAVFFGHYGAERIDMATGERRLPSPPLSIEEARRDLGQMLRQHPGAALENKDLSVVAHFRNTANPAQELASAEPEIRNLAKKYGLAVSPGRFVLELGAHEVSKGDALRELLAQFQPSVASFAGDDLGDVPAFEMLDELAASSPSIATCTIVAASAEATGLDKYADVLCQGPDGLAAWLDDFAAQFG